MSKFERRIRAGMDLCDRLRSRGEHLHAQTVFDLVNSLRGSRSLNSALHRDLQEARRRAGLPSVSPSPAGGGDE